MKEVHLICNAHLDPIWQWEWEEGAAAALSTFRAAADLADEFDYIFCHNEVTLYKYIEEYAPELFARIKKLILAGKWHIMGGWYLQPDCNMPSGESFVRQIMTGHRYFEEKFGVYPTTAINFDPFGHTRGLVQIMKKCGQDSYILCRTGCDPVPAGQFVWEGFDGSTVKVSSSCFYNTALGHAAEQIVAKANAQAEDIVCVLWGVGNHGGGPSRKDLRDIEELKKDGTLEILHSTPERFFAEINPTAVHRASLRISNPGCYTTMTLIKQKHAELENALYMTEKLCSVAALRGLIAYPEKELDEAVEDLLNAEFHDVLPGSSVRAGEENGVRLLDHGLQILNHCRARAYFALTAAEPKAKEGEFPILVFNPHPYAWETDIPCELTLADQNWSEESVSHMTIYDKDGNLLPAQVIKEESNLHLDWRKRILFHATLAPLAVTRFSLYVDFQPAASLPEKTQNADVIYEDSHKRVEIDGETGLLRRYCVDGVDYLGEGAFCPRFFEDNADPWGMGGFQLTAMGRNPKPFTLMKTPDGPFVGMQPVQVIEDGALLLAVEAFFSCDNTKIRMEYDISKTTNAVDVKADVFMNDANRMLKLSVPYKIGGEYFGQTAYGTEPLYMDGRECVAQRFVGIRNGNAPVLAIFNRGTYASACQSGNIDLSLVRGATYCAHPIGDRTLIPTDRFVKKIDMGERNYNFRLTVAAECDLQRLAAEYNQPPYALNVFPVDVDFAAKDFSLVISDKTVTLEAFKKQEAGEGYILRLFHCGENVLPVTVTLNGAALPLTFGRFEVKTLLWNGTALTECGRMEI